MGLTSDSALVLCDDQRRSLSNLTHRRRLFHMHVARQFNEHPTLPPCFYHTVPQALLKKRLEDEKEERRAERAAEAKEARKEEAPAALRRFVK